MHRNSSLKNYSYIIFIFSCFFQSVNADELSNIRKDLIIISREIIDIQELHLDKPKINYLYEGLYDESVLIYRMISDIVTFVKLYEKSFCPERKSNNTEAKKILSDAIDFKVKRINLSIINLDLIISGQNTHEIIDYGNKIKFHTVKLRNFIITLRDFLTSNNCADSFECD